MSSVRSSKNSSSFLTGDVSSVDLNSHTSAQPVGFTGRVERVDAFSSCSAVIDFLPGPLQPSGQTGALTQSILTLANGGSGYATNDTGTLHGAAATNATYKVVTQTAGAITAIEITAAGSGYTRGEPLTLVKTTGSGSGASFVATSVISDLDQKEVAIEIYLSSVDPTDKSAFPKESNSVTGGGLVPTQAQLDTYFNKQFLANEAVLIYRDTTPNASQCVAICNVTQSFMVVQAFAKPSGSAATTYPGIQLLARIESYLYNEALPLVSSDHTNVNPAKGATEATQLLIEGHTNAVSACVDSSTNHLKVDILNTPADALSVGLVQDGSAVSGSNQLPVLATLGATDRGTLGDVKTAAEAGKASLASIDTKASDLSDIKTNTAATTTALGANLNTVLQLNGTAVSASNPLPIITPKFVKVFTFTGNANAGLTTQSGTNLTNLTILDLGLAASKCKFTATWDEQHTKTSQPTATMVLGFLLSFTDDHDGPTPATPADKPDAFNGLLRFETDTDHDSFSNGTNSYMSVNLDLGHVPRYMYMQCEGPVAGSGIACMDNLNIRIFCEK